MWKYLADRNVTLAETDKRFNKARFAHNSLCPLAARLRRWVANDEFARLFVVSRFQLLLTALLVVSGCAALRPDRSVAAPCSPQNQLGQDLLASYRWLAETDDSLNVVERRSKGLFAVPRAEVELSSDRKVCSRAVRAFNIAFAPEPATTKEVHVIRFGRTRYVVVDESRKAGEWIYSAVFDSSLNTVLSLGRE